MKLIHEFFLQAVVDSQYLTDGVCTDKLSIYLRVSKQDEGLLTEGPLQQIQKNFEDQMPTTLETFSQCILSVLTELEFQSSFAFAAAYLIEDRCYLLTRGLGGIFLSQDESVVKVIMGEKNASGRLHENAHLVLGSYDMPIDVTISKSLHLTGDGFDDAMLKHFNHIDIGGFIVTSRDVMPETAVSMVDKVELTTEDGLSDADGLGVPGSKDLKPPRRLSFLASFKGLETRKSKITMIVSIVIVLILIWSVGLGYQRRSRSEVLTLAKQNIPQIESKLLDAQETIPFDTVEAKSYIKEAQVLFEPIMKKATKHNLQEEKTISEIQEKIDELIAQIDKKENKKPDEFYDVSLLGDSMDSFSLARAGVDAIGVIDSKNKKVYSVLVEKKSITTFSSTKLSSTTHAIVLGQKAYILNTDGIFALSENEKEKRVIENEEWGSIVDFVEYNGNLYLLDKVRDEIYKYLVVDVSTFSKKTSYFKNGESVDLSNAVSFAVDGSFYIGLSSGKVLKFTSGIMQPFVLKGSKSFHLDKVLTNEETDKIFIFDRQKGSVLVFSKDGEYKKEIVSKFLKQAQDIILIKNDTLVFQIDTKLYSVK